MQKIRSGAINDSRAKMDNWGIKRNKGKRKWGGKMRLEGKKDIRRDS